MKATFFAAVAIVATTLTSTNAIAIQGLDQDTTMFAQMTKDACDQGSAALKTRVLALQPKNEAAIA